MKKIGLKDYLKITYIVLGIFGVLFLTDLVVFIPLYFITEKNVYLILAVIIAFIIMSALSAGIIVSGNLLYSIFYKGLFHTSRDNLRKMVDGKKKYERYDNRYALDEFNELNKQLDNLEEVQNNSTTSYVYNDYTRFPLQFIDQYYTVVTYESLCKNVKNLILASRAYRNAFIDISYETEEESLPEETITKIVDSIKKHFDYNKILVGRNENGKKYMVYIPYIDTTNALKEELEKFQSSTSITNSGIDGLTLVMPKIAVVIYPYSEVDEILSDLRYASRQGKQLNIYTPNKLFLRSNDNNNDLSLSMNNISKLVSDLAALNTSTSAENDIKIIDEVLTRLSGFLGVDESGVVLYNQEIDRYVTTVSASIGENHTFRKNKNVSFAFIDGFQPLLDGDGTYYFSNRKHVSSELGKYFDIFGIRSGYFYFIKLEENTLGFIYFINKNNSMMLDSYVREALFVVSTLIDHSLKNRRHQDQVSYMKGRINDVSKLSNLRLYSVDKTTFDLKDFSETMKDRNKDIEIGKKCYKCLYNKESPCKDCPILTNKKKTTSDNGALYETSMVLTKTNGNDVDLLISLPNDSLEDHNRFNTDFLTNSYYSFLDRLKSLFFEHSKGYIVTLTIDYYRDINIDLGPEKYALYIRKFVDKTIHSNINVRRVYSFQDNVFIIVLPEMGRVDVCDVVESLYTISKSIEENELNKKVSLNISYDAIKYPQTFDNEKDLMGHVDKFLITHHHKESDLLYFEESDYFRPASRTQFILNTIENAVKNNTFIIRMQPVMNASDKHMTGAEILIRLNDDNRNLLFNTFEMIKVAGDNNKIGIISDLLINFIGDTYAKYGLTLFKQYGFNRISLNTEFSYFTDVNFLDKIGNMMQKYYLPKNFLGFEVNERDIFYNIDKFKQLSKAILSNNVTLICDQYSGEFISIDKLKELGISEIKIGRQKVKNIDTNVDSLNEVLSIIDLAKRTNIKTTLVGVENVDQYNLVKEQHKEVGMQGYYFYQPLDINEMIEALRKNNN